jgi:hypothetical protein
MLVMHTHSKAAFPITFVMKDAYRKMLVSACRGLEVKLLITMKRLHSAYFSINCEST